MGEWGGASLSWPGSATLPWYKWPCQTISRKTAGEKRNWRWERGMEGGEEAVGKPLEAVGARGAQEQWASPGDGLPHGCLWINKIESNWWFYRRRASVFVEGTFLCFLVLLFSDDVTNLQSNGILLTQQNLLKKMFGCTSIFNISGFI